MREERWKLFYGLYLFAYYSRYRVVVPTVVKNQSTEEIIASIAKVLLNTIDDLNCYFKEYDDIILHYDYGQGALAGIITTAFLSKLPQCRIIKTKQSQNPFMQLADLFSYLELLEYKISKSYLTKSEFRFFVGIKNLKNNYISRLKGKFLMKHKML